MEQLQKDQEIQQQQEWRPTWSNLSMATLGMLTTFGLEGAHNPELALLTAALSVGATWKGDDIINFISSLFSQQGRAEFATKLSRKPQALAQPKEDCNVTRLLPETAQGGSFDFDAEDDIVLSSQAQKKDGIFCFSELLASGWRPSLNKIFVGQTMDGKDIFVSVSELCHVALAGKTGGGKGSLERLIMVQLCYIGARTLLLNPHYMRWVVADKGTQFDEDWTPFEECNPRKNNRPYLEVPPVDCADYEPIGQYMAWAVETELQKRKREGREGGKKFKPFFIVVDEWPSIAAKIKEAPGQLGELLREGRKYGIFVVITSQDFQVKTLGMEGGSVRECFLTVFYTGGDPTTGRVLLNYEKGENFPENELGKGIVVLRCAGTNNKPVVVRVPFVDNESVYKLLGPSTFRKATIDSTWQNEIEVVEPQIDWSEEEDEPRQASKQQEITLTLEQLLAIKGRGPLRVANDLPVETHISSSSRPHEASQSYAHSEGLSFSEIEKMKTVKQPVEPHENRESLNETFIASREDETAILMAVIDLQMAGTKITREAIKSKLGWNNSKHPSIKAVCDKHHIAER